MPVYEYNCIECDNATALTNSNDEAGLQLLKKLSCLNSALLITQKSKEVFLIFFNDFFIENLRLSTTIFFKIIIFETFPLLNFLTITFLFFGVIFNFIETSIDSLKFLFF